MADAKWIRDLKGDMPLRKAARQVLALRFGVVRDRLPQAVDQAEEDVEHVHQLRVGTRRAGAALRIFAPLLPERSFKKARKALKRLRRAAGAARDWDVFLDMVSQRASRTDAKGRRGLDFLLGMGYAQRRLAQDQLREAAERDGDELPEIEHEVHHDLVHDDEDATLRDLAVPTLTELLHDLEQAAGQDLSDYDQLHQVRIAGKKLRYAMEIFESCFEPAFRDKYYPAVVEMQEILGQANDSHVAVGRLLEVRENLQATRPEEWPGYRPGIESLLRFHQRRLPQRRQAFLKWWAAWQESGAEHAFAELVAG